MDYGELKEARKRLEKEIVEYAFQNPQVPHREIAARYGISPKSGWVSMLCTRAGLRRPIGRKKGQTGKKAL
jgi:hypothetical protein